MKILDISVILSPATPAFPGDPQVELERLLDTARGNALTLSRLTMCAHSGTHIDAPAHFIAGGRTVDRLDLQTMFGPVEVLDFTHLTRAVTVSDLESINLPYGIERILFKTRNSALWSRPGFQRDFTSLSYNVAGWLLERGIRLVGIDYLSVDAYEADQVHKILLGAGTIILEGLDLGQVPPGPYTLVCLPLKLEAAEGAPCRAILVCPEE